MKDTQAAVTALLTDEGYGRPLARRLAVAWVREADYLLLETTPQLRLGSEAGRLSLRPADGLADFVIGNPPYIRAESIPRDLRAAYIANCKTMTAGTDIFVGFLERGLDSLREGGVLCVICADRWMHNAYGRLLRRMVIEDYSVDAVLKMHGVDAFAEEVSAYPAVTVIRRASQGRVLYAEASPEFGSSSASRMSSWARSPRNTASDPDFTGARLPTWFDGDGLWPAGSPRRLRLLEDLEARLPPLQDDATGTRVGIGVATGADRVFVTTNSGAAEHERLLPLVKGAHVRTGRVEWDRERTWLVNPWEVDGSLVDLAEWPQLRNYLEAHSGTLRKRHVARKNGDTWYRTIDKVDRDLASRPKLLFQDMKRTSEPVLEEGGLYPHHNLYWITSVEWDLSVLGGILLSSVAQMFIEAYAVRMRGGTLRFQAQYLRKIRVPSPSALSTTLRQRLRVAFRARDVGAATEAALEAYGLDALPD